MLEAHKNTQFENYLTNIDATEKTNYSLWKASKTIQKTTESHPPIRTTLNTWAKTDKQKAEVFAAHLDNIFSPNEINPPNNISTAVNESLQEPYQLDLPIKKFSVTEVMTVVKTLKPNKSPGYDLITSKVLNELPIEGFYFLTCLFNSLLRTSFMPPQWKVGQIKMILKPGKTPEDPKSYRPISLLPIASKVMELLFLNRLYPIINSQQIIPDHQFGFRKGHGTIEQVHRIVNVVNKSIDQQNYCTAVFLDISQAFDRVWHDGLLYKLKKLLNVNFFTFLKSYLCNRTFFVKQGNETTCLHNINAGAPQGSIMGPLLYLIYTYDLPIPQSNAVTIGTFADDTVALSVDKSPMTASHNLQLYLNTVSQWLLNWRIKANETKSTQITFTTKHDTCPSVSLNNIVIPQSNEAKYLGIYLDRRLTWRTHIFTKRKALGIKLRSLYPLLGPKSKLSLLNKILLYKTVLKPIWTYGVQLWGTAANSNIEIVQRFQSKVLRLITKAPRCVTNEQLHRDLKITTVREDIKSIASAYMRRILNHPNPTVSNLSHHTFSRLKRRAPINLI